MAEGGGDAGGANYRLSATLDLQDLLSGKLRSAASKIKSVNGAVSKLGSNGEVARLAKQFDSLSNLRQQVEQFKQMKKSVNATRQAYEQANATTAQLARQYKQGKSAVAQLQAKHDELKKTFDSSQSATAQLKDKLSGLKAEAAKAKTAGAVEDYKKLQDQVKATSAELKANQATTKSTGAELQTLSRGVKQAQRELKDIGNAFEQSKNKARQLKRELQTQEPALSRMRQSLNAQGFSTQNFADSDRQLKRRMNETSQKLYTEQRLENLRGTLAAAGMTVPTPTSQLRVNIGGNATSTLGKIKQQLTSLTGRAWNIAVNAKNAMSGKFSGIAEGAMLGMGAQVLGTAGIGYGIVNAVQSQMSFEKQMSATTQFP